MESTITVKFLINEVYVQELIVPATEVDFLRSLEDDNFVFKYFEQLLQSNSLTAEVDNITTVHKIVDNTVEKVAEETDIENSTSQTINKIWPKDAVLALISIVENRYDDMHHAVKRKNFWSDIAENLQNLNIMVDSITCRNKWNNLIRTYKSCIDNQNKTGRSPIKFPYFDRINEILGEKPNILHSQAINVTTTANEPANCATPGTSTEAVSQNIPVSKKCRRNYTSEYLKLKSDYYKQKQKDREERSLLLKRKLDLEERRITALEEYVNMQKTTQNIEK